MRAIDAHTHVFPQYASLAVEVMDRCEIEQSVTLEWHDGFGDRLRDHLEIFGRYPGRFLVFGNVDFRRINEQDFGQRAAEEIRRDAEVGMAGLKIFKALGMEYRHPDGQFWRINDERLDSVWTGAETCGIPVLIHTADPAEFWQPVNEHNSWNGVLYGEYAWWTYYRKGFPCRDELLAERNEVIARHPRACFICPHFGSNSENLDQAAEDLDAYPNMYYDLSARLPELASSRRRRERARQFILDFQDRILFGTDAIYDDTNIPTGMQAQCLYQPFEIPLAGAESFRQYVETTVEFIQFHYRFLESDERFDHPPFKRIQGEYSIQGLGLPPEVCEKLLWKNARKILQTAQR